MHYNCVSFSSTSEYKTYTVNFSNNSFIACFSQMNLFSNEIEISMLHFKLEARKAKFEKAYAGTRLVVSALNLVQ